MVYQWKDKNTEIEIEIERKVKEIDIPPDKDEALKVGMTVEEFANADWERMVLGGSGHKSWNMKGSW